MNWNRIEGQWKQRRGKATHRWGKIMNDELAAVAGKHELLVGILQEKYGIAKEEANKQIEDFKKKIDQLKKTNANLKRLKKPLIKEKKNSNRRSVKAKTSSKKRQPS